GKPGDLAVIFDDYRRFLAIGLYDPTSPMRVRVLHHGAPAEIDRAWLADKLAAAVAWRATLPESGTTGYRLVHGENDGLPGLVMDRYEATLVVKLYSLAWTPWLADLRAALGEVWRAGVIAKSVVCDEAISHMEGIASRTPLAMTAAPAVVLRLSRELERQPEHLYGLTDGMMLAGPPPDGPVQFSENGLRFEADVLHGQKTGFFFDQRDNRARVEKLAAGRRTLNVFAYSGGFSLYAARGGASEVTSLDASAPALAAAERNFALNRHLPAVAAARHSVLVADAFTALADLRQRGQRYDLVIVDPPAFAKRESEVSAAVQTYGRLTGLALGVLAPGGTLVMSSCSSRVSAPAFFTAVNRAATQAGWPLIELDRTGHAIDHPVLFPEGAYLKCLFAQSVSLNHVV
ncbi:MAG: class I SAM-dependent rRNA methyltransferase, partial [Chloroflexi bacterium]|nr:class I SAM-dependent rRNA methyltransferase [Chloroflexota bacterium]